MPGPFKIDKIKNHERSWLPSNCFFTALAAILCTSAIQSCEGALSVSIDQLSESVKGMLDDGFTKQEIINSIKSELSISRIKGLLGKMYEGGELSEEEVEKMKYEEVDDNDEELTVLLKEFGMQNTTNGTLIESLDVYERDTTFEKKMADWGDHYGENDNLLLDTLFDEDFEDETDLDSMNKYPRRNNEKEQAPKPDYAYSPYDLFRLVKVEEYIYKPLKKYIRRVEGKLKTLKRYIKDLEKSSLLVTQHLPKDASFEDRATAVVSNPLTSYKLIKRFALQLPDVWKTIGEDFEEELWSDLSKIRMKKQPPNEKDWKESIESLLRIQYYNGYDTKEFSSGKFGSINSRVKLSAQECMEIGVRALAVKQYDFALQWLYLAKQKVATETKKVDSEAFDIETLERTLEFAIEEHNNAWDARAVEVKAHVFTKKLLDPKFIEIADRMADGMREYSKQFRENEQYDVHTPYNFVSLCAGENLQTKEEKSRLHCWYERSKHPYFYISPMKMELLHEDPPLVQIYEVIGDKLINKVKKYAVTRLRRSQVINYDNPNADDVSLLRTSTQTWIPNKGGASYLDSLSKLIEKITGLKTRKKGSSEDFQVACYGTSHHYDEHLDAVQDPRRTAIWGERVATFMLYLSTVDEGGRTAFPVLGTAAKAVKGSAVFWYNLKKNGEPDLRTWHGGCPVVHNIKWVMNNWILLYENMHNRPCGLNPKE